MPQSFAGARFATTTTVLPMRSSGLYHGAMPLQTVRGSPVPSSSVSFNSFLARLISSQLTIFAARSSTFAKSSMPICATPASSSRTFSCCAVSASGVGINSFNAAISFSTSMRGKSVSPFVTVQPAGNLPYSARAYVQSSGERPSCAWIFGAVSGINGVRRIDTSRSASHKWSITLAKRACFVSSLPSAHGIVSSMYLFVRAMNFQSSSSVRLNWYLSIASSHFCRSARPISSRGASSGPASCSCGMWPPKYFCTIAVVRESRLPRSLARSELMRWINASFVNRPSLPNGISRSRK